MTGQDAGRPDEYLEGIMEKIPNAAKRGEIVAAIDRVVMQHRVLTVAMVNDLVDVMDAESAVIHFRDDTVRNAPTDWVADLRGHDLACWCPLDQPCHADVLLELANG